MRVKKREKIFKRSIKLRGEAKEVRKRALYIRKLSEAIEAVEPETQKEFILTQELVKRDIEIAELKKEVQRKREEKKIEKESKKEERKEERERKRVKRKKKDVTIKNIYQAMKKGSWETRIDNVRIIETGLITKAYNDLIKQIAINDGAKSIIWMQKENLAPYISYKIELKDNRNELIAKGEMFGKTIEQMASILQKEAPSGMVFRANYQNLVAIGFRNVKKEMIERQIDRYDIKIKIITI